MPNEPTIVDVAREAQVSKTTASRVLNGSPNVAPDTRARVLDAVARLDYRVNSTARSLRTSRSLLIGLLVPAISHDVFGRIAEIIEEDLRRDAVGLVIASSGWDASGERLALESLLKHRVDALIISLMNDRDPELAGLLASSKRPIVLLDREIKGISADVVLTEQRGAIRDALQHLASLGHRAVGVATYNANVRPGREAVEAFRTFAPSFGLEPVAEVVVSYDRIDRRSGWEIADRMLDRGASAAICCVPTPVTAGVIERLNQLGLAVPRDLSVVAFDESEFASVKPPQLTIMSRPLENIAHFASRMALQRIANPDTPRRIETVHVHLSVRDSTAPPRVVAAVE